MGGRGKLKLWSIHLTNYRYSWNWMASTSTFPPHASKTGSALLSDFVGAIYYDDVAWGSLVIRLFNDRRGESLCRVPRVPWDDAEGTEPKSIWEDGQIAVALFKIPPSPLAI